MDHTKNSTSPESIEYTGITGKRDILHELIFLTTDGSLFFLKLNCCYFIPGIPRLKIFLPGHRNQGRFF